MEKQKKKIKMEKKKLIVQTAIEMTDSKLKVLFKLKGQRV